MSGILASLHLQQHIGMTTTTCPAAKLLSAQRIELALQALAGAANISHLAAEIEVSRKFIYEQKSILLTGLPLTPKLELQQDVVEDLVQRQLDMWPPAPTREVRQDKFIKLLKTQIRWNPLPLFTLRHFDCQSSRILPDAAGLAQTQCSCGLADNSNFRKTRNQSREGP